MVSLQGQRCYNYDRVHKLQICAQGVFTQTQQLKARTFQSLSDLELTTALMRFAILGNMVGIPGISLPMAFAKDTGLPISMQMQAKHWNEHVLFDLARFLEARAPTKEPAVYYSTINTASV
ncbi:Aste57867_12411 [Aphanomyces stellatus]|uniref:Aste57867_12411 protein n=1 Tax=Aphanomyces stellatus TaxID=120398 RepID=A0A485KWV2_9STRA|nr:hypothetical protein As57867_012365 [Aphanomyces stellatus]VFT89262.1 Aste57867_12411 [Aphanomyces stellatus]